MKVFLDDAQSAIVIATLHDQQQFLSCLLLNSQLNNTERNNIHRMLRSIKNILDNVKETIDNKYDLSAKQLTVIALSLSAFVDPVSNS